MRYEFICVSNYSFFKKSIIANKIHKKEAAPANILASGTFAKRGDIYNTIPPIINAMAYNFRFVVIDFVLLFEKYITKLIENCCSLLEMKQNECLLKRKTYSHFGHLFYFPKKTR